MCAASAPTPTDRPPRRVASIVALANAPSTLAVDAAVETARAEGGRRRARLSPSRSAGSRPARSSPTGEIAWLAQELELTSAPDGEIATAGLALTGLQASLLAIAAVVQEVAEADGPGEAYASRTRCARPPMPDELLPAPPAGALAGHREQGPSSAPPSAFVGCGFAGSWIVTLVP